jgi:hypothetical protein
MRKWHIFAGIILLVLLSIGSAARAEVRTLTADGDYAGYESEGKYFHVQIPGQWQKSEKGHPYGDLTKITGVKLTGPRNKDGAAITLSILHCSGDGIFPSTKEFIVRTLNSMARTDYDKKTVIA